MPAHRLTTLEAANLRGDLCSGIVHERDRGNVRCQHDPGMMPERMPRRQWLVAEHVERRAGEMVVVEERDKLGVDH